MRMIRSRQDVQSRAVAISTCLYTNHARKQSSRVFHCYSFLARETEQFRGRNSIIRNINLYYGNPLAQSRILPSHTFYTSSIRYEEDSKKSTAERSIEIISASKKLQEEQGNLAGKDAGVIPVKKTLMQRFVAELKHYYHGFRLLFIDVKICCRYIWNVLNGQTLTRRERRQLVRTTADLFRLLPFSVFVIVPFMEFLLPVALKLFPGMLPSTFAVENKEIEQRKKRLKAKLEMAKFLQDTVEESALEKSGEGEHSKLAKEFSQFIKQIREKGTTVQLENILKYTQLFKDDITLDNMDRRTLIALCKLLEISPIGNNKILAFQLRTKLRQLKTDDRMIKKEGLGSLTESELQSACRARGMRAIGVPEWRLRHQLEQWLDMHLNDKIPLSLLLISRALYLPETLSKEEQLKTIISTLPESTTTEAELQAAGLVGEKIDPKAKAELLKAEEEAIKREKIEDEEERKLSEMFPDDLKHSPACKMIVFYEKLLEVETKLDENLTEDSKKHTMEDQAEVLEPEIVTQEEPIKAKKEDEQLSSHDIEVLEDVIEKIAEEKKITREKEELDALKEDVIEYTKDIAELKTLVSTDKEQLTESKAAKRLSNSVNKMVANLTAITDELHKQKEVLLEDIEVKEVRMKRSADLKQDAEARVHMEQEIEDERKNVITINELVLAMKRIQKVPDETKLQKIAEILDEDKDGSIDLSHVLRVLQEIGTENVQIKASMMTEIIELLKKEEDIELDDKLSEKLLKKVAKEDTSQ